MRRSAGRPVVITNAERSQQDQLRTRELRYVLMMSVRVVCLITAVVLVSLQPPLLWLWLAICAVGMIAIPWVAVVLANDRLPKEQHRLRRHRQSTPTDRELPPAGPGAAGPGGSQSLARPAGKVIDSERDQ